MIAVRAFYADIFKAFIHQELYRRRKDLQLSQEEMAAKLNLALRTYADIEHGKNGCNGVTLALFLIYICENPIRFLEELCHEFETGTTESL